MPRRNEIQAAGGAYRKHLQSEDWKAIRATASARSEGLCELCRSAARETRHVQYPKGYANDSAENVLHVCSACHRRLHGMNQLISDRQLRPLTATTVRGREVQVWVDELNWVWANWDTWSRALVIPARLQARLLSNTQMRCGQMARDHSQPFGLPDAKNEVWYRWPAIERGLRDWHVQYCVRRTKAKAAGGADNSSSPRDALADEDEMFLAENYEAICWWGQQLQERALAGAVVAAQAASPSPAGPNAQALAQVISLLAGVTQNHEAKLVEHDSRILQLEGKKDPDEFIDAASFLAEQGLAHCRVVPGTRLTVQQWLGMRLKDAGAARGKPVAQRLDGCGVVTHVATWRRADLDAALQRLPK